MHRLVTWLLTSEAGEGFLWIICGLLMWWLLKQVYGGV